jgi:23S rRNA (cytidine1920-2'-O)/16S rRNA (cytidine1409-2'-O)-methyltransferase
MSASRSEDRPYVSRGGDKLAAALEAFGIDPTGAVCADLGCNVGGFTDALLMHGAARVYAIDTGYGTLDYRLRTDPRVVVLERTNAMHVTLDEPVDLAVIDVGWTRQRHILPNAARLLKRDGRIIALIKPHYEADKHELRKGVLPAPLVEPVLERACQTIAELDLDILAILPSPIVGQKGNREYLALLKRS